MANMLCDAKAILSKVNKRIVGYACLYALIITAFLVVGETSESTVGLSFREAFLFSPIQFIAISFLFYGLSIFISRNQRVYKDEKVDAREWLGVLAFFAVIWGINWGVNFPGYWTNDSLVSLAQSVGEENLSAQHPVAFTLLMKVFVMMGNALGGGLQVGMGLFTLFTMLFFAACCSYVCAWVKARTGSILFFVATVAFFALNILLAQYSITAWKDIYFSPFVVIFALAIFDLLLEGKKKELSNRSLISFSILILMLLLFRSNGVFVAIPSIIVLALVLRRHAKKILISSIVPLLVYLLISGPIFSLIGVEEKKAAETYGVPLQQIAKVIVDDGKLSEENREYLEKLFSFDEIKEAYDPHTVDPVKWSKNFNNDFLEENQIEFLLVWLSALPENLDSYIAAYRDLTLGYWYPGVENWLVRYNGFQYKESMNEWNSADTLNLDSAAVSPDGTTWVSNNLSYSIALNSLIEQGRHLPILNSLYSIGAMVWLLVATILVKALNRHRRDLVSIVPLLLLWLSMMIAAPTFCEFRYMLALHLFLPVLAVLLFYGPNAKSGEISKEQVVINV